MSLSERDLRLAQALADVATVPIIQDRVAAGQDDVSERLQTALDTQVLLEQAKGPIAQAGGLALPTPTPPSSCTPANTASSSATSPEPSSSRPCHRSWSSTTPTAALADIDHGHHR